jgi:hypothetical protein
MAIRPGLEVQSGGVLTRFTTTSDWPLYTFNSFEVWAVANDPIVIAVAAISRAL